ncbi:ImmA/IrrE family metallo-endopeptidase [Methylobacterium sp. SyP6R]|uniref:ImmA/IrrE family metallo-endopeptidase n=1 Tax=Methylobacterium sp. SyP6R TaxID=2718876 RepID=UPI001F45C143|nr:ImmA/IrrE family metallo-endopeptidase [Methylobacterium sp. SyP6R]MCF4129220.1 ImmA/IrrE family metallo-endopeptidase [Methylobacterium sp. SyP6R]
MDKVSPIPSMLTKPEVHKIAEGIAADLGYIPGDPIEPLLSVIGGQIAYRPLFSAIESADSIHVNPDGEFTIFMSGLTSAERDRFTIAHELGHLFLHFPLIKKRHPGDMMVATRWVDETDNIQRRAEWEANWFAAAFLMPADLFKCAADRHGNDIASIASEFGVSAHAAQIRLRTI